MQVTSSGFNGKNKAKIYINSVKVKFDLNENNNERGLHIALINPYNGYLKTCYIFDTFASSDEFHEFIDNYVPMGFIVVAACKDDCVTSLSQKAKKWFSDMGSA